MKMAFFLSVLFFTAVAYNSTVNPSYLFSYDAPDFESVVGNSSLCLDELFGTGESGRGGTPQSPAPGPTHAKKASWNTPWWPQGGNVQRTGGSTAAVALLQVLRPLTKDERGPFLAHGARVARQRQAQQAYRALLLFSFVHMAIETYVQDPFRTPQSFGLGDRTEAELRGIPLQDRPAFYERFSRQVSL